MISSVLIFNIEYAILYAKNIKKEFVMANKSLTATYEALPKIAKIIIQIFLGALVGGVYRILRYIRPKIILG